MLNTILDKLRDSNYKQGTLFKIFCNDETYVEIHENIKERMTTINLNYEDLSKDYLKIDSYKLKFELCRACDTYQILEMKKQTYSRIVEDYTPENKNKGIDGNHFEIILDHGNWEEGDYIQDDDEFAPRIIIRNDPVKIGSNKFKYIVQLVSNNPDEYLRNYFLKPSTIYKLL